MEHSLNIKQIRDSLMWSQKQAEDDVAEFMRHFTAPDNLRVVRRMVATAPADGMMQWITDHPDQADMLADTITGGE